MHGQGGVHIPSLVRPNKALYMSLEQQGKHLYTFFFLRTYVFSFRLIWSLPNSCPFVVNILILDDPFWWYWLKSEEYTLWNNPVELGFLLVLRSGGKWLSLELKISKYHLDEDLVVDSARTGLLEHWGITTDISPTLIFIGERKYMLTLGGTSRAMSKILQGILVKAKLQTKKNSPASDRWHLYIALGH